MRSKLFVPGSRPELFAKALASAADAISIDLEDAVAESRKTEARAAVADFLASLAGATHGKIIIVRVNAQTTPHFAADLEAVVRPGVDLINLAKIETAEDVETAGVALDAQETARRLKKRIPLLVNIETPKALRLAAEIASADPRVAGLQLGLADLLEPLGIARDNAGAVQQIQLAVRLAAGEAGVWAYDSAYANVSDTDGLRSEAEHARRLGYIGKSCIHPSQVPIANAAFQPTEAEIAHALRVVNAVAKASSRGLGAFMVDGHMVDAPFMRRAEIIVATARKLGLAPSIEGAPPA